MNQKFGHKTNWRSPISAITLIVAMLSLLEAPGLATPEISKINKNSFKLAQVGVTSEVNAPIPLNLRARTHIPLPTSSRSSDYDADYGYSSNYNHYPEDDEYHYHDHYHHHQHRDNQGNNTIIIINSPAHSHFESYSNQDGYIRIIRQE